MIKHHLFWIASFLTICQQQSGAFIQIVKKTHQTTRHYAVTTPSSSTLSTFDQNNKEDLVALPQPLGPFQRATRAASFWSQVIPILATYAVLGNKLERMKAKKDVDPVEEQRLWDEAHDSGAKRLTSTIMELKGFYVKSAQVISSRPDMFPAQYCTRLQSLQDSVEAVPASIIKAIIRQELLEGEPLSQLFKSFDEIPLGSASIAQVHKAVLLDNRTVAVKVQRWKEEPKLRGDIKNLKAFAGRFRDVLPVDYYRVFTELENALADELDFYAEAQSMYKIAAAVAHTVDGKEAVAPVIIPRPIPGLYSKRVLIMEYIDGVPLSKLKDKMAERGVQEGSPEAQIFARRLLSSLTEAFARMTFGPGFIHADPHPGNIFVMEDGRVALIDCGQKKQLSQTQKLRLAQLVMMVAKFPGKYNAAEISDQVKAFGVEYTADAREEIGAALALMLFGESSVELPGGYSPQELSNDSPLKQLKSFPTELVLLGRATVLIKGIAARLGVNWNLAEKFAESARICLESSEARNLPIYATITSPALGRSASTSERTRFKEVRTAFRLVRRLIRDWAGGKLVEVLPDKAKKLLVQRELRRIQKEEEQEQHSRQ